MASPLQMYSVPSFQGGINDFAASLGGMQEFESLALENLVLDGRGRLALRNGLVVKDTLQDSGAADILQVLWVGAFGTGTVAIGFSSDDDKTWLFSSSAQDGSGFSIDPAAYATPLYTGSTIPVIIAQEIEAPSGNRLYFVDRGGNYNLTYWDGTSITVPTSDLDDDGSGAALTPTYVAEFNYHLFISGFDHDSNVSAPEIVRWSTPGLIALPDDDGHADTDVWWMNSFEAVGRPGEPIKIMAKAGGGLVIIKENNVHYWWGSDTDTWGQRHISAQFGAVNEAHVFANGWIYYMSEQGPARTNGQQVQFIGENIRQFIQGIDTPANTVIIHDPLKFQVMYFFVDAQDTYASLVRSWSYIHDAWTGATYYTAASTPLKVRSGAVVGTTTLVSPAGPPTNLAIAASLESAGCVITNAVTWDNGDTAPSTTTELWRIQDANPPIEADWDGSSVYQTLAAGVASYDDNVAQNFATKYWYQVRHVRNNQNSTWNDNNADPAATDVSVTTTSQPAAPSDPSGLSGTDASTCNGSASTCPTVQTGGVVSWEVELDWTNNHSGHASEEFAWIQVQGKDLSGGTFEDIEAFDAYDFRNDQTYATQSVTVNIAEHASTAGTPKYNYFRIRVEIQGAGVGCNENSSWTGSTGQIITEQPCSCDAISV